MLSIESIVCKAPRGVASLVGGGGKTSLMFHLARQLAHSGKKVLTTTTTKIFVPTPEQSRTVIVSSDPHAFLRQVSSCQHANTHITAAAHKLENGKLLGFAPEAISIFQESRLFDWILVEADGAARRSLKAPAEHEPVIPANTSVLVAVAGLDALGEQLSEKMVFRSALAGPLMGLAEGEVITQIALARLIAHPCGSFKAAPSQARRFIFLNKADSPERLDYAARVAEQLRLISPAVAEALIVGQALDGVCVHAVYPLMVTM